MSTIPAEPVVVAEHVSGSASAGDYKAQMKKQLEKPKNLKSFGELAAEGIEVQTPSHLESKAEPVDADKAMDLIKKKSAGDVLRAQEAKERGETVKPEPTGLDDLSDLSEPVKPKPEKKGPEENLANLRKKSEALEKEKTDLQKLLQEKEDNFRKREKELSDIVEKSSFRDSPKFKENFQAPVDQARTDLSAFAKEMTDDDAYIPQLLALKGKERVAFIEEKTGNGALAAEMLRMANEVDRREGNLRKALDEHENTKAVLKAKEEADASRESEQFETNFKAIAERMSGKVSFYRRGDNADHNAGVDERIAAAKAIASGTAPQEDVMVAPFLAVIARDVLKENAALKSQLAKYKARVRDDNSGEPIVRGESEGEDEELGKGGKPMGMLEAVRKRFGRK